MTHDSMESEFLEYIQLQRKRDEYTDILQLRYDNLCKEHEALKLKNTKVTELLGLYQNLFNKLELTVEHDTADTWDGCVDMDVIQINGDITDEVRTVIKIKQLQKELGEMK